jgi:hypothetical protein
VSPTGGGRQGEELSPAEALFEKLKVKAAKDNIAIHPLIPPPAGDTLKATSEKGLDLNVALWKGTTGGGTKRERGNFRKAKSKGC